MSSHNLNNWIHKLHSYVGLIAITYILLFSISAFLLNHRFSPWDFEKSRKVTKWTAPCIVKHNLPSLDLGRSIALQVNVEGEIRTVMDHIGEGRVEVGVYRPGYFATINVDKSTSTATIEETNLNSWYVIMNLHTMTGLHSNLQEKRNWWPTRVWSMLMDFTVFALAFLATTGIYMWIQICNERKIGVTFIVIGFGIFIGIVVIMILL